MGKRKIILKDDDHVSIGLQSFYYRIIVSDEEDNYLSECRCHCSDEIKLLNRCVKICSETFNEAKLINNLRNTKIKMETLEGLTQIINLNNKCYHEINRLKTMLRDEYQKRGKFRINK